MKLQSLKVSAVIAAPAPRIYAAWLSGREHAAMTGGRATGSARVGGKFTAWDGYIAGTNIELEPYRRILQAWRTSEFPTGSPDSRLEVLLEAVEGGTRLTINHSHIPEGQGASYAQGWQDFYFTPMRAYYLSL